MLIPQTPTKVSMSKLPFCKTNQTLQPPKKVDFIDKSQYNIYQHVIFNNIVESTYNCGLGWAMPTTMTLKTQIYLIDVPNRQPESQEYTYL